MKRSIFVTGIAGSGKSAVSQQLKKLGYESYDIEDNQYGLFMMVRKDTGKGYLDYDNSDMSKVNNALWVCNKEKLKKLIDKQSTPVAFYCGVASRAHKMMTLFDRTLLLRTSKPVLYKRLLLREGTEDFANTENGRQQVIKEKNEFEGVMKKHGAIPIDADIPIEKLTNLIIKSALAKPD